MKLAQYVLQRFASYLLVLFIGITITFFLPRLMPGDPIENYISQVQSRAGQTMTPEAVAQLRDSLAELYGLKGDLFSQYLSFLNRVFLHFDFGPSFQYRDYTVTELIVQGFPVSLTLGSIAIVVALIVGITAGSIAALKQNSRWDHGVMALSMTGISIPNFVMAPLLVLVFAVYLRWLPAAGLGGGSLRNLVLPITALALPQIAYLSRLTRGSKIEVLRSNFIRTAKAQGLPTWQIVVRHALKPALLPIVSYIGPATAMVITGSVVIEQIFAIPGLGRFFVTGALNRDYTLVMGVVVFYGVLIILFNFLVDLAYAWLDPKVKLR
jgi:oligopeptide transport system permease protein